MKIVNPLGKEVNMNGGVIGDPRGCMCSGAATKPPYSAASVKASAGSCFVCRCSCKTDIPQNDTYNHSGAKAKQAY